MPTVYANLFGSCLGPKLIKHGLYLCHVRGMHRRTLEDDMISHGTEEHIWHSDHMLILNYKGRLRFRDLYRSLVLITRSDAFVWAATIMDSRSFTSLNVLPDMPAFPVLYPVVDIANHSVTTKVRWEYPEKGPASFSLKLLEDLGVGAEICNNYGPKQNDQLLLAYGFAIPNNPVEQVTLSIGGTSRDALRGICERHVPFGMDPSFLNADAEAQVSFLRTPGHIFGRYKNDIPFFRGFPPNIVYTAYSQALRARGVDISKIKPSDVGGRLVLGTLLFLYGAIQVKCAKLRLPNVAGSENLSVKQKYANIYRDGQVKIWRAMRRELKAVLEKLRAGDVRNQPWQKEAMVYSFEDVLLALQSIHPGLEEFNRIATSSRIDEQDRWVLLILAIEVLASRSDRVKVWSRDLSRSYPPPIIDSSELAEDEDIRRINLQLRETPASTSDSVWAAMGQLGNTTAVIAWAIQIVHCETFYMPDREDPSQARLCMYMPPLGALECEDGGEGEKWIFEEVAMSENENEGEVDIKVYQGKFGH